MTLDKAIKSGKEWRKAYQNRDARSFDPLCRNHGACKACRHKRLWRIAKKDKATKEEMKDYGSN